MRFLKWFIFFLFLAKISSAIELNTIIDKIEAADKIDHAISTSEQKVITSSGKERVFEIKSYSMNANEKALSVYTKPARVKGEKILSLDDGNDIWSFSPKTNRVRHLATHMKKQKVMGSDFSYEDMNSGKLRENYKIKLLGEEKKINQDCYKLEMVPTKKGPSYKKVIAWVNKQNFLIVQNDYYNDNGLLKSLMVNEVKEIDGKLLPWSLTMENKQSGGKTIINTITMDMKSKPKAWRFTQEGLKRK